VKTEKDIAKIKKSFEDQSFKAPAFDFDQLDKAPVDKVIRKSFESRSFVAPAFDFNQMGSTIDEVVKDSFDQVVISAPADGWERIQDGLTVNKVWENIASDIIVKSSTWQRYIGVAAAMLLLIFMPQLTVDNGVYETFQSRTIDEGALYAEVLVDVDEPFIDQSSFMDVNATRADIKNTDVIAPVTEAALLVNVLQNNKNIDLTDKLDVASISTIDFEPQVSLIPHLEFSDELDKSKMSFSLGLTAGANRTWLRDVETRNALEKNTISSSKFSLGGFYGVQGELKFNEKWATQLSVVKGNSRNRLGVYNNGLYNEKVSEINYFKFALSASYAVPFQTKNKPWSLKSKLGFNYSSIGSSFTSTGDVLTSLNDLYANHNVGVLAQIGPELSFGNFIFETGLNFEQGLLNIYNGNGQISSDLNYTSNREFGVFTSIRYILK